VARRPCQDPQGSLRCSRFSLSVALEVEPDADSGLYPFFLGSKPNPILSHSNYLYLVSGHGRLSHRPGDLPKFFVLPVIGTFRVTNNVTRVFSTANAVVAVVSFTDRVDGLTDTAALMLTV